jgi:hypothetical protein
MLYLSLFNTPAESYVITVIYAGRATPGCRFGQWLRYNTPSFNPTTRRPFRKLEPLGLQF